MFFFFCVVYIIKVTFSNVCRCHLLFCRMLIKVSRAQTGDVLVAWRSLPVAATAATRWHTFGVIQITPSSSNPKASMIIRDLRPNQRRNRGDCVAPPLHWPALDYITAMAISKSIVVLPLAVKAEAWPLPCSFLALITKPTRYYAAIAAVILLCTCIISMS